MNSVLQISRVPLGERFSIDCKGLSFNQFVFSLSAQNKKQLSIFILTVRPSILVSPTFGSYFAAHDTDCIFYSDRRRLQTIREKCVLLICDTFGVFWFLSLEYVIFYCFSIGFRISSQLKRVQFHF